MSARVTSQPGIRPANGLSHVAGSTDRPLIEATIPAFLAEVVRRHGHRAAAVFRQTGDRWSYDEFARLIDRLAAGLLSIGVYKGDRVGIWSPNRPEWLLAQFATARIGAILVNINPAYRTSELDYALNKAGVSCLIVAPQFKSSNYMAMLAELAPEMATCPPGRLRAARLPALRSVVQLGPKPRPGALSFDEVMDRGNRAVRTRLDAISASLNPDDAINIQFTSGTTGAPKGATLSHRNIVNNAISTARAMRLQPGEGLCIPVPFYHCFGMVLGNLAACSYGVTMVIPGEAFDARDTLAAIDAEGCAALHGVPTMFQAMLDHPEFDSFDMRSLRTGIMAGAPCPEPLMRRVMERMHLHQITIGYGMTETSPISFQSAVDDPLDRRVSTVGRIQPHAECKVVGPDGRTLPVGQQGELLTRGYLVMKGYWNDPERTAESIQRGWMHTGDLATIDAEGYCRITGRSKDMLIRGGENVYPAEVEEFLTTHPDISQAQVFGLPDAKYGEEVATWIILRPGASMTEDALRDWCRGKIAHYKVPRYIRFVTDMPMTVTGKPQKFIMRDKMMADLGLTA
ncbi:AMP-binding protein [Seohaeicola sp. SP36]|uniref:AMP-binding protein n=1 Tax=unclassified Seohaeicola TaxID=2641111 RepID=UPI00237B0506|nr:MULTISPECIES: AMP-binding protein [unclassified Seohaeicola]MDD9707719.1 AMP-binding protein [Seohaeicola sp. 4SK31]MDD9735961.1 AMP-binding protein [Seohaeicola sp. SP36]